VVANETCLYFDLEIQYSPPSKAVSGKILSVECGIRNPEFGIVPDYLNPFHIGKE